MSSFWSGLLQNRMLLAAAAGWSLAQITKVLLVLLLDRRFSPERFFGSGGMPSAHSATVCAPAAVAAILYGSGSFQFALAAVVAFVVMYDACNVRLETGKQAAAIKALQRLLQPSDAVESLKELVGHTLPQVLAGAVLGVLVGVAVAFW